MQGIDYWFSIGSTYTYLTMMRLDEVEARAGVTLNLRPFNVRTIMVEQKNIPFTNKPVKTAYMWRDIERRANARGVPAQIPAPYPLPELQLANQIALLGMREGWGRQYVVECYRRWFQHGEPGGEAANLAHSLAGIGDVDAIVARAQAPEIEAALEAETVICRDAGVFGSPSFVVGDEVFWGDDRLEDAIKWARDGALG